MASGLSLFWFKTGVRESSQGLSMVEVFQPLQIPFLSQIPFLGEILFSHRGLTYFAFLMAPVIGFFLYRTRYGLEIRRLGENPRQSI